MTFHFLVSYLFQLHRPYCESLRLCVHENAHACVWPVRLDLQGSKAFLCLLKLTGLHQTLYDQDTTWQRRAKHKASGKYVQSCHSTSPLPPPMHRKRRHTDNKEWRTSINLMCKASRICPLISWLLYSDLNAETTFKEVKLELNAMFCQWPHASSGFIHVMRLSQVKSERWVRWNHEGFEVTVSSEFSETQMEESQEDVRELSALLKCHGPDDISDSTGSQRSIVITSHLPVQSYLRCQ